jgi:hypothetical protein
MFWNKKLKLPVTQEDQNWVEESFSFLKDSLGELNIFGITTLTPTKNYFDCDFDGSQRDAEFILERCCSLMDIPLEKIILEFYSEESNYLDDGTLLSSPANIFGQSKRAAGTYHKKSGKSIISIELSQLKHPESLIATISHELAHEKLLGENRIVENDEHLTDLTAIIYGFGVFIANAKFQFSSGHENGFGWRMKSQGYLPEQVIAYAMASLALKRGEHDYDYKKYLDSPVEKYFDQCLEYLQSDNYNRSITAFWQLTKLREYKNILSINAHEKSKINYGPREIAELQKEIKEACYQVDVERVELLLQKRVSPNFVTIGGSPLAIAVRGGNKELIDCLLHYGADINFSEPETMIDVLPLMAACENENTAMMSYLIDLGANVNCVGGNGNSILEVAIKTGNTEVVKTLFDAGANIEIKSGFFLNFNKTPLTAAVANNDTEMVSFLVKSGAKTKPLRKLTRHEIHPKMVKFLKSRKYL